MGAGPATMALAVALVNGACAGTRPEPAGATAPPDGGAPTADGGASAAAALPPEGQLFQLVDDMEGGMSSLATSIGLASWYAFHVDSTTSIGGGGQWAYAPPSPARNPSKLAQHLVVTDPAGADLRVDFHGPRFFGGASPYPDLSAYAGIAFWARGSTSAAAATVAIQDDTVTAGNAFAPARASAKPWFEHPIALTSEWRRHVLLFEDFHQPGQTGAVLNTQAVWAVHLLAGLDGGGAEIWLDDLALLCRGRCPAPSLNTSTMSAPGTDEASLKWTTGDQTVPAAGCADVAALSMTALSELRADPVERVILRARVHTPPPPAVPAWAWSIQNVATGALVEPTFVDDSRTTVAVPLVEPGDYHITVHTHHPMTTICGADVVATAH